MFSPRESFRSIENFVDHIADVVSSSFHSTKTALEAEIVTLRAESKETIDGFKHDLQTALARLDAIEQRIDLVKDEAEKLFQTAAEKVDRDVAALMQKMTGAPPAAAVPTPPAAVSTPVNMPPGASQDENQSQDFPA